MKYNLDDLSFMEIVNIIQHDKKKGRKMLIEIAMAHENQIKTKAKLENELARTNTSLAQLHQGIHNIFIHLKLEEPLYVPVFHGIVIISHDGISIERNVLREK